jgi:hypothetical protein
MFNESSLPPSTPTNNNRQYDNFKDVSSSDLLSLFKLGFKLVPLDNDHEHDTEMSLISYNPNYWHPDSFSDPTVCSRFVNVASALGKTHMIDPTNNKNLYLQVLDTDLDYVYNTVTTPLSQLIIKSDFIKDHIYNVLQSVGEIIDESHLSKLTVLEFCKKHTYVTKTKKENGYHIWWLSRTQNESILTYECKRGFEVDIKADERGGLCTLPPSTHRDDEGFTYYTVGRTDGLLISDILYNLFIDLFRDCLRNNPGKCLNDVGNERLDFASVEISMGGF